MKTKALKALLRKELTLELRTRELLPTMLLFIASTFVIFHFALERNSVSGSLASGVFWVSFLFAATLSLSRIFVADYQNDALSGFLLTPVSANLLLLAKVLVLVLYFTICELIALPVFIVLLLSGSLLAELPQLALVALLVNFGLAVSGVLAAGLASATKVRELITALLTLPLSIPLLILATKLSAPLFAGDAAWNYKWLLTLALYDIVVGMVAYAVFDYLLEE